MAALEADILRLDSQIEAVGKDVAEAKRDVDGCTDVVERQAFVQHEMALRHKAWQLREERLQLLKEEVQLIKQRNNEIILQLELQTRRIVAASSVTAEIVKLETSVSTASELPNRRHYQYDMHYYDVQHSPLVYDGRPYVSLSDTLPASLLIPEAALFVSEVAERKVCNADCLLVNWLVQDDGLPYLHQTEADYQRVVFEAMNEVYLEKMGLELVQTTDNSGCIFSPEGNVQFLVEATLTDAESPAFRGALYVYEQMTSAGVLKSPLANDKCPSFLLELVGPLIRVSALSRVIVQKGDGLHVHRILCEPLTPFLSVLKTLPNEAPMVHLAAVFGALNRGIMRLQTYYREANRPQAQVSRAADRVPALPYALRGDALEMSCLPTTVRDALEALNLVPGSSRLLGSPDDSRLLYYAIRRGDDATQPDEPVVIKFCLGLPSNGDWETIHRTWASKGLAPKLWGVVQLPGNISMAVMEFLSPEKGWYNLEGVLEPEPLGRAERDALRSVVHEKLAVAHGLLSDGRRPVHGDARPANVLVRLSLSMAANQPSAQLEMDADGRTVCFIDFDTAGWEGTVLVPTFRNACLRWPSGMNTGEKLTQEMDHGMIDMAS